MTQTVLLAERDASVRHMLAFKLRSAGYSVVLAADADDALDLARSARPTVIIADASLCRADGTRVHTALAGDEATEALPVLLLTSGEDPVSPADAQRIARILHKPVGPTELLRVVQEILCPASAARTAGIATKRFAV